MPATTEVYAPGDFLLGGYPFATRSVTIVSGAGVLVRGTVIGQITTGGKYTTALSASSDGSEGPAYMLAEDVDATSADKVALVYDSAVVDGTKLTFGTGITSAALEAAMQAIDRAIYVKTPA